ncbi:MAG: hypothetical protein ACFCVB_02980 [Nodosilinea sp.]
MVDADGQVTNLDDLCDSGGASQAQPPQGELPGADSAQPATAPQRRSFTIIGTPTDADPSEATVEPPSDPVDAQSTGDEPMGEQPTGSESMGEESVGEESVGEESVGIQDRSGIPVEGITTPTIEVPQIQTPTDPNNLPRPR